MDHAQDWDLAYLSLKRRSRALPDVHAVLFTCEPPRRIHCSVRATEAIGSASGTSTRVGTTGIAGPFIARSCAASEAS